ncbi:MAG TPA: hypothetical protein VHE61_11185 [Opitutaceae bacterium]|nr:hypothetical protein [Opitutaceae bacterium]
MAIGLHAADIPLQPFVIDHRDRVDSPVDVSFLLDPPAGKYGFITVKDGHLVQGNGRRFRIWGVNLTGWTLGSSNLPPKDQAAFWAKTLARAGIDCVRFHFLDLTTHDPAKAAERAAMRAKAEAEGRHNSVHPAGLVDGTRDDTQHFDPAALDRLDYFVAELKKVGIYSNLNLNVGREYKPGDHVPDSAEIWVAKGMTYIGDRLIALQRDYARQLLTHRNPYTGHEYRHEPAVATVELVNENSIVEFWARNWLRGELTPGAPAYQLDFTPHYAHKLDAMYQVWLERNRTPAQLAVIRQEAGVAAGAPVPRLRRGDFSIAGKERFDAEAEFYTDVESRFFLGMRSYLKNDLGVKSVVIATADHTYWIPNQPLLRSTSLLDGIDGHVYWQHPAIYGARNTPMVDDPLHSSIVKLTRSPMLGRPYTVSESNEPNPNDYAAEFIPLLAAYGAFQDWDGIYFYTFEPKVSPDARPYVDDYFDISLDPVKMIQLSVGALMFTRPDVAPARTVVARTYSREQVDESLRLPEADRPYFTPGFPLSLPLRHESRIRALDAEPTGHFDDNRPPPYRSDTGELTWFVRDPSAALPAHSREGNARERDHQVITGPGSGYDGLVTIDTPRTQALIGFVRDNGRTTRHLAAEVKNDFCAITLSSLTPDPIERAPRMLLTACSRWQNSGAEWDERHTMWTTWGHGPTLIEPVTGWLVLRELDGAVAVKLTPLDGAARPIGKPLMGRRLEDGWEIPLGSPPTNWYLVEVVR